MVSFSPVCCSPTYSLLTLPVISHKIWFPRKPCHSCNQWALVTYDSLQGAGRDNRSPPSQRILSWLVQTRETCQLGTLRWLQPQELISDKTGQPHEQTTIATHSRTLWHNLYFWGLLPGGKTAWMVLAIWLHSKGYRQSFSVRELSR